jgi:hypothetical protein
MNFLKVVLVILMFFGLSMHVLRSQTTLSGIITDEQQTPLANINILVYAHGSQSLFAFGFSDSNGKFVIRVQSPSDSLRIEVTSVQYRKDTVVIANKDTQLTFGLVKEVKDLSEFVMRASPIERRGDTISYLVSTFAREQDRSIADVLSKMPGIEVEPSGRILYQGEPIQHFYVEGLDLMGGRYGLVSSNMPHHSVATVQILENHQPIKILEERLSSHRASLNITLKRDITTTGTARLGSGLIPFLWDANITPMMFTKNFQLAGSYQANNTGNDAAKQLDALTMENFRERLDNYTERPSLLDIPGLSPPGFNENRYLDNNIHLLNANTLTRLARELQLRTNLHFIYDNQLQQGDAKRTIYTPNDTLVFDERISNQLQNRAVRGEITLTRNTKQNYLNNKLEFQSHWDQRAGEIVYSKTSGLNQQLNNPFRNISNRLNMVKPVGSRLINLNSFIYYDQSQQTLWVNPGGFHNLIDQSTFESLVQEMDMQRVITNHSAGLSFGRGGWMITPRAGFSYQQHWMTSELFAKEGEIRQATPYRNSPESIRTRTYLDSEIVYKPNALFSVTAQLPLSHQFVEIKDAEFQKGQTISRFTIAPRISTQYHINSFWQLRASYAITPTIGETTEMHYSYILKNYRNIHINDAPLFESLNHGYSLFLGYRNPLTSFFSSLAGVYSFRNQNLIYSNTLLSDGSTILRAIQKENIARSMNLNARTSKYFSGIGSTLSCQGSFGINWQEQWVNESIFNGTNYIYTLSPKANIRFTDKISTELRAEWLHYNTWHGKAKLHELDVYKYFFNVLVFPARAQHMALYSQFYQHSDKLNYFVDLHYRYSIEVHKIDLDVRWINILNHKTYHDYQVGSFMLMENHYMLRPMQLVAMVRFSF